MVDGDGGSGQGLEVADEDQMFMQRNIDIESLMNSGQFASLEQEEHEASSPKDDENQVDLPLAEL